MKLRLSLVILGVRFGDTGHFEASLEALVHGVGAWMFLLRKLPEERQKWWSVSLGQGEGKMGSLWAGGSRWGSWRVGHRVGSVKVSGLQVLRTAVRNQLSGLEQAIFPLRACRFFLCKWRC